MNIKKFVKCPFCDELIYLHPEIHPVYPLPKKQEYTVDTVLRAFLQF